ncbi:helix-turn-helix domain-containing protein [Bradyrhizobium sp. BR 1432]|uniref:helix-turn-helix domain-containing protein n=1 Tax=Bradyrhizobium sp. BR 1432 TaxID=3447966 RepID=UPI003EE6073A
MLRCSICNAPLDRVRGVWHKRDKRLASWLCLASWAADTDALPITHDYLSSVLGIALAGITETLNQFADQHLIRKMRGMSQIDERERLEQRACTCYKLVAEAYASSGSAFSRKKRRLTTSL